MRALRFSVLLPTHNRADILSCAIQSVLAQTLGDFELLIAGDGCTDASADVVRSFDDERIRWFDLPKAPHFGYANRNVALRLTRGELIAYIAHDDLWLPDHLELLSRAMDRPEIELAYSLLLLVSPDGIISARICNLNDANVLGDLLAMKTGIGITCVVHRRDCLENYGYWDETMPSAGDTELWGRMMRGGQCRNFAYLPIPTALHFFANWRKPSWRAKAKWKIWQMEGSLLPELCIPVPAGMPEQQAIWEEMRSDPVAWTDRLRRAVQLDLDRRATGAYPSSLLAWADQLYRKLIR